MLAIARDLRAEPAPEIETGIPLVEYRQLQERLAHTEYLLDHAPEMVLWMTPTGAITYANQTAAEVLGFLRSRLQQMALWELDADLESTDFPTHVEHMRTHGRVRLERRMRRADGTTFPVSVTGQLVHHGDRDVIISFSRDISEEIQARNEAQRYLSELARVSRQASVSELASAISHEINQPLTAILMRCSACLRLLDDDRGERHEIRQAIDGARANTERIREIVARLREYMQGGETQRKTLPAGQLLHSCTTLLYAEARHASVELRLDMAPDLPSIEVDPILIQQVVLNLVRNAIEAVSGLDPTRRTVRLAAAKESTDRLTVDVIDTGAGIDPDITARVFEPFYSTKGEGMGIGLSLCRSIVESHNGQLTLASTSPAGTTFRLGLPTAD